MQPAEVVLVAAHPSAKQVGAGQVVVVPCLVAGTEVATLGHIAVALRT